MSLLLVHDFLLSKGGIALPATHGLRAAIDRHKSRLTAEFTRARIRRKCASLEALRENVETSLYADAKHPRWIRINSLKTTLENELTTTFEGYEKVDSVQKVLKGQGKLVYVDEHVPSLVAVSPRFDFAKCAAYKSGALILQDKASCFPAYLLDPQPSEGDVIDTCAAPGNKTTHLAAIIQSQASETEASQRKIHAFEKDERRAKTLEKMINIAGSDSFTHITSGQDFLKVDPSSETYKNVGALLLDPSCSGSGIVGRDDMPELHLPMAAESKAAAKPAGKTTGKTSKKGPAPAPASKKRKRTDDEPKPDSDKVLVDDDGNTTVATSEQDLETRLEALSSFQLLLLLHAFSFPAARKITYSTCSIHKEENEHVVLKALRSDVARQRGWRVLPRKCQVEGMREWPVRGTVDARDGDSEVADACIRAYKDDGRGVMGFFVAAFVRDGDSTTPYVPRQNGEKGQDSKKKKKNRKAKGKKQKQNKETTSAEKSDDDGGNWGGFDD